MSHATRRMLSRRATTAYRKRERKDPNARSTLAERKAWLMGCIDRYGWVRVPNAEALMLRWPSYMPNAKTATPSAKG